jgi:hypothetical protein
MAHEQLFAGERTLAGWLAGSLLASSSRQNTNNNK